MQVELHITLGRSSALDCRNREVDLAGLARRALEKEPCREFVAIARALTPEVPLVRVIEITAAGGILAADPRPLGEREPCALIPGAQVLGLVLACPFLQQVSLFPPRLATPCDM